MTLQRPNVAVFQEFANLTVTPDIPDLNVCVVGPSEQLLDYLDDKDECYAADYGTFQSKCPLVSPTAVIIATPPNIVAGGTLVDASVKTYFDAAEVVIEEDAGGDTVGVYTAGDNLFEAHTTTVGTHFGEQHVAPGDVLIVDDPSGTGSYIMTVKELCYTLHDYTSLLNFQTSINPVQPGDLVILSNDNRAVPKRNGTYVVKRVVDDHTIEVVSATWVGTPTSAAPLNKADVLITDAYGAPRTIYLGVPPQPPIPLTDYCNLRMTSDFVGSAVFGDSRKWRVERKVSDILLALSDYTISGNQVTVDAAITVDLDYDSYTLSAKKVSYAKIYMQYAALRTDLQKLTTLSNYTEIETALGKYDSRNPLMVGAVIAKANTTTPIKVYGVPDDTLPDYLEFLDRVSVERDIYAIVPLTYSTSILAAIKASCENLADPTYALTNGVKQKFRVVIGAVQLQTTKYMVNPIGGCTVSQYTASSPGTIRQFTLSTLGTGILPDFFTCGIAGGGLLPGDVLVIHQAAPPLDYSLVVAQVNDSLILETDVVSPWGAGPLALVGAGTDYIEFQRSGVLIPGTHFDVTAVTFPDITLTAAALDDLFLVLTCPTASFLTSGCIPGDLLEIPNNPTVNNWSATSRQFVIDEVVSNQKIRITNTGNNTSIVESELPHGGRRTDGTEIIETEYVRVLRNLDKTQQVSELVAVAQSMNSKRCLLCFPDLVDVTSLVDGSATRITDITKPEPAVSQPGYYLSCAVGGQTAGQPPHQGFTNLGIAGVDRIYHSVEYFTEVQLTDLSNGGIYVFIQDNPSSLPMSIHEVTTDTSALEFGEYMVIKDFDFVAWTFLDTLLPFIGPWNVTDEAIEFIRQALYTTGDNLKARKVAKIGSPLLDYSLDNIGKHSTMKDRIVAYLQVDLPMTLNVIELHLVA